MKCAGCQIEHSAVLKRALQSLFVYVCVCVEQQLGEDPQRSLNEDWATYFLGQLAEAYRRAALMCLRTE